MDELDASVARALGYKEERLFGRMFWIMGGFKFMEVDKWKPSSNGAQASPIMIEHKITIAPLNGGWQARTCVQPYVTAWHPFDSLIAAMQCFVKSKGVI